MSGITDDHRRRLRRRRHLQGRSRPRPKLSTSSAASTGRSEPRGSGMRIGVMVGPERGRYAHEGRAPPRRRPLGGGGRRLLDLGPADPRRVRRLHRGDAGRRRDEPGRGRHRGRARAGPAPDRARPAGAVGAGGLRAAASPRTRRVAPLDHRRDARPALRATGGDPAGAPRRARPRPRRSRPRSTSRTTLFRVHNPLDITDITPTPVLLAALGPVMLRLAGERTDGTILWMADERAIDSHVVPHLTKAAEAAGRPAPRIVAGDPCVRLRRRRGRRRLRPHQPHPVGGGGVAQLPEAPRPRRRRATSATSSRPAASPPSRSGCGRSPTPASPTSASASSPSARAASSCSPLASAPASYLASLGGQL